MFNLEQWRESKVKHCIWDELIIHAKAAWEWVIKHININNYYVVAMLQGFHQTWGTRNVLYRREYYILSGIGSNNVCRYLSLVVVFGGMGVVLGRWGAVVVTFYMAVFRVWGPRLPSLWACFLGSISIGVGLVGLLSQKKKKMACVIALNKTSIRFGVV